MRIGYITVLISSVFALNTSLYADSIMIGEVSLPVDQVVDLDQSTVKVELFSASKIVSKSDLEREVLSIYARSPENLSNLGSDFWKRLCESALKNKRYDLASRAIAGVLIADSGKDFKERDWIEGVLSESINHPEFVKGIVELEIFYGFSEEIRAIVVHFLARADLDWLKSHHVGLLATLSESLKKYGENRFKQALITNDLLEAERVVVVLNGISGYDGKKYVAYKLAVDQLKDLSENGPPKSMAALLPIISLKNSNPELSDILKVSVVKGLHSLAENYLSAKKFDLALEVLSNVSKNDRTPTTHTLILESLSRLEVNSRMITSRPIQSMVDEVAQENNTVKEYYIAFLERKLTVYVNGLRNSEARAILSEILKLRPDPSPYNDELRIKIATGFLSAGETYLAEEELSKNTNRLSIFQHFRMFRGGLYGDPLLYIVIFTLPLVLKFTFDIFRPGKRAKKQTSSSSTTYSNNYKDRNKKEIEGLLEEDNLGPAFVTGGLSRQLNPLMEEYLECLRIFNVKQGGDLKSIKVAYRNAVKSVHPDLNVNKEHQSESSKRFMELTSAYDRLCELHKLLGFPS